MNRDRFFEQFLVRFERAAARMCRWDNFTQTRALELIEEKIGQRSLAPYHWTTDVSRHPPAQKPHR